MSEDPKAFSSGDLSLYRYVNSSPQMYTDPEGEAALSLLILTTGAALVAAKQAYDMMLDRLEFCRDLDANKMYEMRMKIKKLRYKHLRLLKQRERDRWRTKPGIPRDRDQHMYPIEVS